MNTSVRFTFDKLVFDKSHDINAVVYLGAPKLDRADKRPPILIVPVIDISGSMVDRVLNSGESKLDFAKKSVNKLIDHLRPGDFFAGVKFSTSVEVICKPEAITDTSKVRLQSEVAKLSPLSSTNLSDAMLRGLELANSADLPKDVLVRVILFTDGLPNAGISQTREGISKLLTANLGRATLSAFGYGTDADQELLSSLASLGKGNFAFIDNPDKAATAFARELGGLLSTYAQNIVVEIEPQGGHEITKVISDVTSEADGKNVKIEVADLLSEETRHIVLAVKTAAQSQSLPRPLNVLALKVSYDLIDDDGKRQHKEEEIKGKIEFVKDGSAQDKPTKDVEEIVGVHQVLEAQLEADKLAQAGNYNAAFVLMDNLGAEMQTRGLVGGHGMASYLKKGLADSHVYASFAGARSSVKSATRGRTVLADDETEAALFCANVGVSNSMQQDMVSSFVGDGSGVEVSAPIDLSQAIGVTPAPAPAPVPVQKVATPSVPTKSKDGRNKTRSKGW